MEPTFPLTPTPGGAYPPAHEANPMLTTAPLSLGSFAASPLRSPWRSGLRPGEGGKHTKSKSSFKIGAVTVTALDAGGWQLRYRSGDGVDVRRRLGGLSEREVRAAALNIAKELLADAGFIPGRKPEAPTVAAILTAAIEARNTRPATLRERSGRAESFIAWLKDHHPAVATWDQLRPAMVQAYVVSLERRGLAFDSVRLALAPIKLAARYAAENHPETCRPLPSVKLTPAPPGEIDCLEPAELAALLDWLRGNAPDLHAMGCLQGLAGLRMLEAAALRRADVNLEARTLTITDTGWHKPKTRDSWRTLPLCPEVADALRDAMAAQKVIPATGELFAGPWGERRTREALSVRWTRTLRRAAADLKRPRLAEVPAKGLRRAFATMASRLGASDRTLKAYLGHSAGDMLGGHYRRIDPAELKMVSEHISKWRESAPSGAIGNILATGGA